MSKIEEIINSAIRSKRFISGECIVEKNGKVSKINGQIFDIKTAANGSIIVLIDNFLGKRRPGQKKRWQAVLMKNIISISENGWTHIKQKD